MRFLMKTMGLGLLLSASVAMADLEPWKDYDQGDAVWSVTTVRVLPNMDDGYLVGLAKSWVSTNEIAKRLGQIEAYRIYRSEPPQGGDFNMLLVVKFKNTADLAPNKARYDAFMKEIGKEKSDALNQQA